MNFDRNLIGSNIAKYRIKSGLKPSELARLCDVTVGYINNLERGIGISPTVETLQEIADALEVDIDRLLEDNLSIYNDIDVSSTLDREILRAFYSLPVDKKECMLSIIRSFNLYKGIIEQNKDKEEQNDLSLELRQHIKSSTFIQEILAELIDLDEDQQRFVLDMVRAAVENIIRVTNKKENA